MVTREKTQNLEHRHYISSVIISRQTIIYPITEEFFICNYVHYIIFIFILLMDNTSIIFLNYKKGCKITDGYAIGNYK